jgi:arylsulfatase A-like enzyme
MRLNRKRKLSIILTVSLVVVLRASLLYSSNKPRNLNVLLITIDSLRPDHLSCYGYKRNTSPNIDKLAKEGVLFTQAISQATWTWPSIHSLITSTYPSTHKVYFYDNFLSDEISTLPYILKGNGYVTVFISAHGGMGALKNSLGKAFDIFKIYNNGKSDVLTKNAISWINKNINKKFFLWIHYMDVHEDSIGVIKNKKFIESLSKKEIENYIKYKYDEAIHKLDAQISILLQNLKILGLSKNTIVIITADHGVKMDERFPYFSHGGRLYDSLIKIPLIFHYPRLSFKNRIISHQVQLIDIAPAVCDILGIRKPKIFEGKSFLSLIKKGGIYSQYVFSEHIQTVGDFLSSNDWSSSQFSVRTADWKLIYTLDRENKNYELYNLKADPNELHNLAKIEKDQFKPLKAKLEEWMKRPRPKITPLTEPLDEDTKERLKSLGYLQ